MKLTLTTLKAPWPAGAKVGDVIELPAVPVWAVGKCTKAPEDAEVTLIMPPPPEPEKFEPVRDLAAELIQAEERLELVKQAAVSANDALRVELDASQAKLAEALAANAELADGKAQAEAKLAEALAAPAKGKAK